MDSEVVDFMEGVDEGSYYTIFLSHLNGWQPMLPAVFICF